MTSMAQELIDGSVTAETQNKISQARNLSNRPFTDKMIPYKNFAQLFREQAEKNPNKTYLIYRDGSERKELSYKDIYNEARKIAAYLYHEMGIRPGDRVSTLAYNHDRTVVIYYAIWMIGAVLVPINVADKDENIVFVQENSEVKAVFVMPDLLERYKGFRDKVSTAKHFISMGKSAFAAENSSSYKSQEELIKNYDKQIDAYQDLDQLMANYDAPSDFDFESLADHDTEALIVYTSGTTGAPKGVVLEQYNVLCDAFAGGNDYGFGADDRAIIILPIHHVNGLIVTLVTPWMFGSSAILNRRFSSSTYWKVAEEEEASCGSVVPTILAFLCEAGADNFFRDKLKKDFFLLCGAGPLTVDLVMRFQRQFDMRVVHGYGLSETTAFNSFLSIKMSREENDKWLSEYGYPSIGSPISCNEMAIHDENGNEVSEGERGEIVIRGHNVMKYYFKRPEVNEITFANNWFRSGDEGFYLLDKDAQKQFFITGRIKELIIRGGVNYSTFEIDEVLNEIQGVKAAMAVGFENDAYGEEVGAYVVLEEQASLQEQDILDYCKSKLPFGKSPKVIVFGKDFPVTATGKYKRNELKPLFKEFKTVQFSKK